MNTNLTAYSVNGIGKIVNSAVGFVFYYRLVFVMLSIVLIAFIGGSVYSDSAKGEALKNLSIVIACGSVFIGIFYSVINYEHSQTKFTLERAAAKRSLSYTSASEWFKPTMVDNLKKTRQMFTKNEHFIRENKATSFSKILDEDEQARAALVSIFNYFECVSIGIDKGILDEEFMRAYLSGVCISYQMDYGFYIDYKRVIAKSPRVWINFTNMAERWKSIST